MKPSSLRDSWFNAKGISQPRIKLKFKVIRGKNVLYFNRTSQILQYPLLKGANHAISHQVSGKTPVYTEREIWHVGKNIDASHRLEVPWPIHFRLVHAGTY